MRRVVVLALLTIVLAALFLLAMGAVGPARAQEEVAVTPAEIADLATPRSALATFLASARDGEWQDATRVLDLREIPEERRDELGELAARDLDAVLQAQGVAPAMLPDETDPEGRRAFEVARVPGVEQGIVLRRVWQPDGVAWRFSPSTVRVARVLADSLDRGPLGERVPEALRDARWLGLEAWQWIAALVALLLAVTLASTVALLATFVLRRAVHPGPGVERALHLARPPLRIAVFLGAYGALAVLVHFPPPLMPALGRIYVVAWVLTVGWLFVRMVDLAAQVSAERAEGERGWRARGVRTRVLILRRVLHVVGITILIAVVLLQIDSVRELGVSLLASAGVLGIIIGLAAQRPIANLLAGLQLSLTQPLRVGDEVVIDGQFGTVDEIHLSYVVLQLWDRRRLIVPMAKLLESPFENWTRQSSDLVGSVEVHVDFETPFDRVRREVEAHVREHPFFDGETLVVQVVEATERTAKLRVLVSASDSGRLFDLRCAVREFLLSALQQLDHGRYLPRVRIGTDPPSERSRVTGIRGRSM